MSRGSDVPISVESVSSFADSSLDYEDANQYMSKYQTELEKNRKLQDKIAGYRTVVQQVPKIQGTISELKKRDQEHERKLAYYKSKDEEQHQIIQILQRQLQNAQQVKQGLADLGANHPTQCSTPSQTNSSPSFEIIGKYSCCNSVESERDVQNLQMQEVGSPPQINNAGTLVHRSNNAHRNMTLAVQQQTQNTFPSPSQDLHLQLGKSETTGGVVEPQKNIIGLKRGYSANAAISERNLQYPVLNQLNSYPAAKGGVSVLAFVSGNRKPIWQMEQEAAARKAGSSEEFQQIPQASTASTQAAQNWENVVVSSKTSNSDVPALASVQTAPSDTGTRPKEWKPLNTLASQHRDHADVNLMKPSDPIIVQQGNHTPVKTFEKLGYEFVGLADTLSSRSQTTLNNLNMAGKKTENLPESLTLVELAKSDDLMRFPSLNANSPSPVTEKSKITHLADPIYTQQNSSVVGGPIYSQQNSSVFVCPIYSQQNSSVVGGHIYTQPNSPDVGGHIYSQQNDTSPIYTQQNGTVMSSTDELSHQASQGGSNISFFGKSDSPIEMSEMLYKFAENSKNMEAKLNEYKALIQRQQVQIQRYQCLPKIYQEDENTRLREEISALKNENETLLEFIAALKENKQTEVDPGWLSFLTAQSVTDPVRAHYPDSPMMRKIESLSNINAKLFQANKDWHNKWEILRQQTQEEKADLEAKVKSLETVNKNQKDNISTLEKDIQHQIVSAQDLMKANDSAVEDKAALQRANDALTTDLLCLKTEVKDLTRSKRMLETELASLKNSSKNKDSHSHQTGNNELQTEIGLLKQQLTIFAEDFEKERKDRSLAESKATKFRKEGDHIRLHFETKLKKLSIQVKAVENDLRTKVRQNADLLYQVDDLKLKLQYEQKKSALAIHNPYSYPPAPPSYQGPVSLPYNSSGLSGPVTNTTLGGPVNHLFASGNLSSAGLMHQSSPEHLPGAWKCNKCTYVNYPNRTVCDICGHTNLNGESLPIAETGSGRNELQSRGEDRRWRDPDDVVVDNHNHPEL